MADKKTDNDTVRLVHANGGTVVVSKEKGDQLLAGAGFMTEADAKKAATAAEKSK